MFELGIIADDLTGACDTGAIFAEGGAKVQVYTRPEFINNSISSFIPVINTQSRYLSKQDAYQEVRQATLRLRAFNIQLFLKKMDAMLRGNIGTELKAIMDTLNLNLAFVVPAIPEMKRCTLRGFQLVRGIPIDKFTHKRHPLDFVPNPHIPDLLSGDFYTRVGHIDLTVIRKGEGEIQKEIDLLRKINKRVIVVDAEKDEDIRTMVKVLLNFEPPLLLMGSLGLAKALSILLLSSSVKPIVDKTDGRILLVSGSINPVTLAQLNCLHRKRGVEMISLNPHEILQRKTGGNRLMTVIKKIEEKDLILSITSHKHTSQARTDYIQDSKSIIEYLTFLASSALREIGFEAVILVGGETSYHFCDRIQAKKIKVTGQLELGIACGTLMGGPYEGTKVVIKGGSVGEENTLVKVFDFIKTEINRRHYG
jgi:uncharacterized protein YgbK (DUF1537 family)